MWQMRTFLIAELVTFCHLLFDGLCFLIGRFSKPGSPQSHGEHRGSFLMIQSGDGDWIINSMLFGRPSGIESQKLQDTPIQGRICVLKGQKVFIWRVPPRQIKNVFSVSSVPLWWKTYFGQEYCFLLKNRLTSRRCDLIAGLRDFAFHNRCGKLVDWVSPALEEGYSHRFA